MQPALSGGKVGQEKTGTPRTRRAPSTFRFDGARFKLLVKDRGGGSKHEDTKSTKYTKKFSILFPDQNSNT